MLGAANTKLRDLETSNILSLIQLGHRRTLLSSLLQTTSFILCHGKSTSDVPIQVYYCICAEFKSHCDLQSIYRIALAFWWDCSLLSLSIAACIL